MDWTEERLPQWMEEEIEKKIMKDMVNNWTTNFEFCDCHAGTNVSEHDLLNTSKLNEIMEKLYLNLTPEERTLKATDDKYDTIYVPNEEMLYIARREFGDLNFVINNHMGKDTIIMFNSGEGLHIKHMRDKEEI